MTEKPQYRRIGGRDSSSSDDFQDVEHNSTENVELAEKPWSQAGIEWSEKLRETSWESVSGRASVLLDKCQLPTRLATPLVVVLAITTLILFFSTANNATPLGSFQSLPQLINDVPWDRYMSGLKKDAYVGSDQFPRSLGKDLVILDVDTRPWGREKPAAMSPLTWGRLNHYLYAKVHGYDYRYIQAEDPPAGTHATWVKVPAIRKLLKARYKFIVFLDSDAIFPHLKIPIEYMLDHWNVTSDIAMAVGLAIKDKENHDRVEGKQTVNTGFMVVQNTNVARRLFKDWDECPTDIKYSDCSHWKNTPLHEQDAYSDYIRYDYPNNTIEIPCTEVNGAPQHRAKGKRHCGGELVRHFWMNKKAVKEGVEASIAEIFLPGVVRELVNQWVV